MRHAVLLLCACSLAGAADYPDRWFFLTRNLSNDAQVSEFRELAATAAAHGYNGVCWSGLEGCHKWPPAQLARLTQVRAIAAEHRLELIPLVYSVGYGGGALGFDRSLAVGHPAKEVPFQVTGRSAAVLPDPGATVANAGFEEGTGDRAAGWAFHDQPGQITFRDRAVRHSGEVALRFENPGAKGLGSHARAMQEFTLQPYRPYRLTLWVKAEQVSPAGCARIQVMANAPGNPTLVAQELPAATFDWQPLNLTFSTGRHAKIRLYFGSWEGRSGTFWLDDVSLTPVGLRNVLRREGCPVRVTAADGATVYEEGRHFEPLADPRLLDFGDRPDPPLTLPAGSRIADGARLLVSWYHAQHVANRQLSVCMSAPRLNDYFDAVAAGLAKHVPAAKVLLSMDEIRQGGTDLADQQRGLSMAQILGDCLTRQQQILRRHLPGVTCYVWSDMLDPQHNAHGDYYQVEGDYSGAADFIPRDLVIACWYQRIARASLTFFSARGHRTLAAAYYDADTLDGSRAWLEAMRGVPGVTGIMYTTWQSKYALLGPFGDLVRGFPAP
ncbi:MAG: hypothetical protein IT204_17400 [Fimbriimonadaceae bacterium]|nr:hypothetical protein [Fimbriimonadaceae bacterium]